MENEAKIEVKEETNKQGKTQSEDNISEKDNMKTDEQLKDNKDNEELFKKLDSIIDKRLSGLTKSILRDNGVNDEEEIKAFMTDYNNRKNEESAKVTDDFEKIKKENEELKKKILDGELSAKAISVAKKLNINTKYITQIMKLSDLSEVAKDGSVDENKLSEAFTKVIEECDIFKNNQDSSSSSGFKNIGADVKKDDENSTVNKIRAAMGLKN